MEIYGTIHFKLILPHVPGFQQEPLPAPVCSHSPGFLRPIFWGGYAKQESA